MHPDRTSAGRSRQCEDAPQWTGTQKGYRPSSTEKGSQMLQSLAKAGEDKAPPPIPRGKGQGTRKKKAAKYHSEVDTESIPNKRTDISQTSQQPYKQDY